MKTLLGFVLFIAIMFFIAKSCEPSDPYEEGMHFDYRIECENGFVYKLKNRISIQVLNSDGTPLKCGHKIY
jgi:hypothetical protein